MYQYINKDLSLSLAKGGREGVLTKQKYTHLGVTKENRTCGSTYTSRSEDLCKKV
jgi:hypothetical protein